MDCHHCQLGLDLGLLLGLSYASGASCKLHVAYANLGHIQALALDAHDGHLLPDSRVLDVFDAFVGLVEVAGGEVEAEVEDGVFDDLVVVVDLLKIVEGGLLD